MRRRAVGRPPDDAGPSEQPPRPAPIELLAAPPGWREQLDDLTGGLYSRFPPAVLALGLVAVAVVALVLVRQPGGPPATAELPMAPAGLADAPGGPGGPSGAGDAAAPAERPEAGTTAGSTDGSTDGSGPGGAPVTAHIAGAVVAPGVRTLPAGARLTDLVAAAGGVAPDADLDRVNLAAPVVDGSRVWVPRRGEEVPALVDADVGHGPAGAPGGAGTDSAAGGAGPATVSINHASEVELEELPGVGPATAAAIVAHREANGPFRSVDDLLEVRGIGPAKLEQIRPLASL